MLNTDNKKNAQLPEAVAQELRDARGRSQTEFFAYIIALREERWPLRTIGDVFGVTRVAAKAWFTRAEADEEAVELSKKLFVPRLPINTRGNGVKAVKLVPDVPVKDRTVIRDLAEKAKNVRRWTPADSPERDAALELEELLYHYHKNRNVPVTKLAEYAGVTRRAVAQRLEKRSKIVS